jgi:hypothetical protein
MYVLLERREMMQDSSAASSINDFSPLTLAVLKDVWVVKVSGGVQ